MTIDECCGSTLNWEEVYGYHELEVARREIILGHFTPDDVERIIDLSYSFEGFAYSDRTAHCTSCQSIYYHFAELWKPDCFKEEAHIVKEGFDSHSVLGYIPAGHILYDNPVCCNCNTFADIQTLERDFGLGIRFRQNYLICLKCSPQDLIPKNY